MDGRKINENTYIGNTSMVDSSKIGEDDKQSEKQLDTDYLPTATEQKILDALLDPANKYKNVTELCSAADVGRKSYYEAFKKPEFATLYRKLTLDLVKQSVAPVVNTFIKEATRGSFQHGKVLLEMAEMYQEGGINSQNSPTKITINILPQPSQPVIQGIPTTTYSVLPSDDSRNNEHNNEAKP
jgi:hypothetical protein